MTDYLGVTLKCVGSFLVGVGMAAVLTFGDVASVSTLIAAASMLFFSRAMLAQHQV